MRADGCAGCVARSGRVGGRELGAGAGARRQAGARQGERARGALGRAERWRARGRAAGREGAQLGARCARGTAGRQHGRAACAHRLGQLGQLGARAPGLVFSLVFRLGIFPESLNEHCSL